MNSFMQYSELHKPFFSPPGWIFGPIWTLLYIMMAYAAIRVFMRGWNFANVKLALFFFALQLVFNLAWTTIFFTLQLRGWAFIELIVMLVLIVVTMKLFFKIDVVAGWLMVPYVVWVSFAGVLNFSVWWLNR